MSSLFRLVDGLPKRVPPSIDVWPFRQRMYHRLMCVIVMKSLLKSCWFFQIIFTWESPSLWQNISMIQYHCSSFPAILQNWKCDGCSLQTFTLMLLASYWHYLYAKKFHTWSLLSLHLPTRLHQPCMICFPIKIRCILLFTALEEWKGHALTLLFKRAWMHVQQ